MNPEKPLSPMIVELHNRTVADVAAAIGIELRGPELADDETLRQSTLMNHALRKHVLKYGAQDVRWRVSF